MSFGILTKTGKVDKAKSRKAEKNLYRACDKISKTIYDEVTKFQASVSDEDLSGHFWGSVAHRAFLHFSQSHQDVYVSAEIADMFASKDLSDPTNVIDVIDIDRLDNIREKENAKKRARGPK